MHNELHFENSTSECLILILRFCFIEIIPLFVRALILFYVSFNSIW